MLEIFKSKSKLSHSSDCEVALQLLNRKSSNIDEQIFSKHKGTPFSDKEANLDSKNLSSNSHLGQEPSHSPK